MKKFTICAAIAAMTLLSGSKASASVFEANDNSLAIRPVLSLDVTCPGDTKIDDMLGNDGIGFDNDEDDTFDDLLIGDDDLDDDLDDKGENE